MKTTIFSVLATILVVMTSATGSAGAASQSALIERCESWDTIALPEQRLLLSNNTWGSDKMDDESWYQCIFADQSSGDAGFPIGWSYDWRTLDDGQHHAVKAYPEVVYGNKHGNEISPAIEATGLPATLAELPDLQIDYAYRDQGSADREINVAAESFIHSNCDIVGPGNPRGDNREFEMMVWLQSGSEFPYRWPRTIATIGGELWEVYADPVRSQRYLAFVAMNSRASGSLNWNAFIDWVRRHGELLGLVQLQPDWCVGAIEFGTEIWHGQGRFELQRYSVTRRADGT